MWWSIVTLGTVGYGDMVPVPPLGKMIAAVTILCGTVMSALGLDGDRSTDPGREANVF
jgi:voltage-gated potassium channel